MSTAVTTATCLFRYEDGRLDTVESEPNLAYRLLQIEGYPKGGGRDFVILPPDTNLDLQANRLVLPYVPSEN